MLTILQRAFGPQAPSCEQGSIHLKLMQTSLVGQLLLLLQPMAHTPLLQTWLDGHCWLDMQEIMHMLSLHCSPIKQSFWLRQEILHCPAWQVDPPLQSPSDLQPWLSRMQVLASSGLGMNPLRHWHSAARFLMVHSVLGPHESKQMFLHFPPTHRLLSGQSLSPLGQLPSGKQPVLYGSPTLPRRQEQVWPEGVEVQRAVEWQGDLLQASRGAQLTSGRGFGRVPGGQEHLGRWFSGRHTAFRPQVSDVQTSMQLKESLSQNLVAGQSLFVRQDTALQPCTGSLGSPLNLPGGHVHLGE